MKSLILSLFLLTCLTATVEAGPIRKAIAWKADHTPVRDFFAKRKPVRKAVKFVARKSAGAVKAVRGCSKGGCCQ
jgi:hypothetical protein